MEEIEQLKKQNLKLKLENEYLKKELYFNLGIFLKVISPKDPIEYRKKAEEKYVYLMQERARKITNELINERSKKYQ